jgi:two-component system phosphate regulon sensor histidine kinase PhoR
MVLALLAGLLAAFAASADMAPLWALALGSLLAWGLLRLGGLWSDEADAVAATPETVALPVVPEDAGAHGRDVRRLLDRLPVPLLVISRNGRVSYANAAATRALPRVEIGSHFTRVIRAPAFIDAITGVFHDAGETTLEFSAHEGSERFFEARIGFLPGDSGFGEDEMAIVQIEDRTRAQKSEQLRSDFIANASHELRTPLASIIGYVETLQNHARDDPEARERFLAIMAREAGRMQRLVDDLMSLSRIEMSEHDRPDRTLSLNRVAADSASAFLPIAEREDMRLVIDVPDTGAEVVGDRDQLAQVFGNLVDNAMKYGGRGVEIRVSPAAPSPAHPDRWGISVSDTGPGIDRPHLPRLTERFYRVNVGQSRNRGGTGLGLAIVKHILNRHRGRLEIVSEPGRGSTFTIWLPCAVPVAEMVENISEPSLLSRHKNVMKS